MDVAAVSDPHPKSGNHGATSAVVEGNMFAQLLDQHLASQESAESGDHDPEMADDGQDDYEDNDHDDTGPEDDAAPSSESAANDQPDLAADAALALALLGDSTTTTEPAAAATAQANQPTVTAATGQTQANEAGAARANNAAQTATTGDNLNKPTETRAAGKATPDQQQARQPGAQVTGQSNPELQARPATVTAASATSIQEAGQQQTSLREGRYDATLRQAQDAPEQAPPPNQSNAKTAGDNTASRTPVAERPDAQQAASQPQTATAVKPAPSIVGMPSAGTFQPGLNALMTVDDAMKLDVAGVRGTTTQTAANTAAKPATPPPPARTAQQPAQQVAMQIKQAVKTGTDHIRIQLQPAELGKVDVQLTIRDDAVQATVTVERPEALEQLQRDSRQLIQGLEDAGLRTNSDSLTFRHGHSGQHDPNSGTSDDNASAQADDQNGAETNEDTSSNRSRRHDGLISIEA